MRASGFMPQSVDSVICSGDRPPLMTLRTRSAIMFGVSTMLVRMSSTPTCTPLSFGQFFRNSTPAMWRFA